MPVGRTARRRAAFTSRGRDVTQTQDERLTVTVFGAGISGLTAAHELAIRGFKVHVIDQELNEWIRPTTLDRGVGGIARSQWACWPPDVPCPGKSTPVVDGRDPT